MGLNWHGRDTDLLGGVSELPARVERRVSKVGAVASLAVGLVVMAAALPCLSDPLTPEHILALVLLLPVGLLWLAAGVHTLISHPTYTFRPDAVRYSARSLLGRREWEEPLSAYRGVLMSERPTGKGGTCYVLTLKHRERRARDVLLHESFSLAGMRPRQEHCARLLGVPAVTETADGLAERAAADLDKSVRQRVAEGSLEVAFDPASRPPGHGLALEVEGDALVLRSHLQPLWSLLFALFVMFPVAATLTSGRGIQHALAAVWGWLHVLLLVAGVAGLGWRSLVVEELSVSPREVRRRVLFAGRTIAESALPSDRIEEVALAMPRSFRRGQGWRPSPTAPKSPSA